MIPIMLRAYAGNSFEKGPINLGPLSIPLGMHLFLSPAFSFFRLRSLSFSHSPILAIVAVLWLFVTSCFFLFPTKNPVTYENMNYACVMVGGLGLIVSVWWVVDAHKWFSPKRFQGKTKKKKEKKTILKQRYWIAQS
jgi:hypothetical protein